MVACGRLSHRVAGIIWYDNTAGDLATAGAVPVSPLARHLAEDALPKSDAAGPQPERFPAQGNNNMNTSLLIDS